MRCSGQWQVLSIQAADSHSGCYRLSISFFWGEINPNCCCCVDKNKTVKKLFSNVKISSNFSCKALTPPALLAGHMTHLTGRNPIKILFCWQRIEIIIWIYSARGDTGIKAPEIWLCLLCTQVRLLHFAVHVDHKDDNGSFCRLLHQWGETGKEEAKNLRITSES